MKEKIFIVLALIALFTMTCFAVFLLRNKDSYGMLPSIRQYMVKINGTFFGKIMEHVRPTRPSDVSQKTTATSAKPLELCPDSPPKLVGPLLVEFETKRTLEDVRNQVGLLLQQGGRFKPSNCIARQKVAFIIPFRNRFEHLNHWLYYVHPILIRQQLDYGVYVINQEGDGVFNRAKLMNIGFVEALHEYDYECFAFADVDLVPIDDRNLYRCSDDPRHLSVAIDKFNYKLSSKTAFGGVSLLSKEQFLKVNGFSNTFWGWGGEDDDLYNRIILRGMSVSRPDSQIAKYKMIKHQRDAHNEVNPKNAVKAQETQNHIDTDGLNSLNYTINEILRDVMYTFMTVDVQAPAG
ncbi:beta-1,4-galactosyltransferase 1-like [Fundulus heteroclitus]|uniref:beta-1,4-galactosyltransferase 1-like n=1 Tax=Fundulus heteroclitus TaxID=8078 RepID=UPI00165C36EC|nr:beta-1,4-galactosyltransferase 1-like [Fundulus heteroclitus]